MHNSQEIGQGKTHIKEVFFLVVRPLRSGYPPPSLVAHEVLVIFLKLIKRGIFSAVVQGVLPPLCRPLSQT